MAVDATNVLVGKPDQAVTGAILSAPLGTTLPTSATTAPNVAFVDSGYVSEDGLALATDRSTTDVRDWSGNKIRTLLESFDGTLSWAHLEINIKSLKNAFGDANVTESDGLIAVRLVADLPAPKAWVFNMKDGDRRMRLVVPSGQVTSVDEITFKAGEPITLPLTLACSPDANGVSIYWYLDSGESGESSSSSSSSSSSGV